MDLESDQESDIGRGTEHGVGIDKYSAHVFKKPGNMMGNNYENEKDGELSYFCPPPVLKSSQIIFILLLFCNIFNSPINFLV